jgi:hypothetical protein
VKKIAVTFILFFGPMCFCCAQGADSTIKSKKTKKVIYSNARKATIMSAILPGLGQIYNKKHWKLPIIYGGFAGFGYMFYVNNTEYLYFRKNLRAEYDDDSSTRNETFYSGTQLQTQKVYYKRLRDISIIGIGIIYLLNVVDANVDAHLKTFDVSDDLSLNFCPELRPYQQNGKYKTCAGLSLKMNFK